MQKLMLAEGVFDNLENNKGVTIRKGRRNILLGELLFESVEHQREAIVNVSSVEYCALEDVPNEDVWNDGFEDQIDMYHGMKQFYPDIEMNTEVTIVRFDKG